MGIKIFADAASNLFREIRQSKGLDIKVMNMHLMLGDKEFNCYDDEFDINEFANNYYKSIGEGVKASTSLIPPAQYVEAFEEEIKKGNKVICFTMAKGISGTYSSACIARDEVNEKYDEEKVYVVDSVNAGLGEGMQAIHAAELVKEGKDFDYIKNEAEAFKMRIRSEFTVDDIRYLLKTGRVSKFLSKFANLLKIKIMLKNGDDSKIAFAGSVIGRKSAIKRLAKLVDEKIDRSIDQTVYLTHCACEEDAKKVVELLNECGITKIETYQYDFISGAHIGPNSLAVFYLMKQEEKKSLLQRIIRRKSSKEDEKEEKAD